MTDSAGWSLTESDPGIMTGILHELGLGSLEVEELYALDPSLLHSLQPIRALIFLFKYVGQSEPSLSGGSYAPLPAGGYFAHQVINNACASVALINAVMNIEGIELGDELTNLKAFSEGLDPEDKGWTMSGSEKIRQVHNSFARADPFHLEEARPPQDDEDAYHFICYVPIGDTLYELDGLKPSPVSHGLIPGGKDKWTDHAEDVLERRIATYPPGEIMFNLLCITQRRQRLRHQVEAFSKEGKGEEWEVEQVKEELRGVEERMKDWEVENELRRWNYVGLIHALLLELAKKNELDPAIDKAKEVMKKKIEERRAKGGNMELDEE